MTLRRRQALLAASAWPALLRAQPAWPARPIRLVVPFAPGGGPDVLTRQFLPRLGAALGGATLFVDNKVGAGGIIAAEYVAQQPADGYTLLLGASTHLVQKLLQPKAAYDPVKGFSHVTRLSYAPSLLVVAADSPYRSLDDLLKAARAAPGRLNYGSGGVGSAAHLAGAALATVAGVEVSHIPYRGSVDLPQALISHDIAFAVPTATTALPQLQAGKLRALAVTTAAREPTLPGLPTLKELTGSEDLVLVAWSCLWLPAGAPPSIVRTLFEAHAKAYADTELVKANALLGSMVSMSASESEFAAFVAAEMAKFERLVKAARISVG